MLRTSVLFLFLDLVAMTAALASPAPVRPLDLRTEYRTNPAGIDVTRPELGWRLSAADPKARGLRQSAWRILAASSEADLAADKGELWDSGRTPGSESAHIAWRGRALGSGMQVFWKVQVWDQDANPSAWSALARFSIGLLSAGDWKARWIGRDEQAGYKRPGSVYQNLKEARWIWSSMGAGTAFFRSSFAVPAARQVVRAFCVAGADSSYELFLNGKQIGRGSSVAMPEVYDFTGRVTGGANVLAVRARNAGPGKPAGLIAAVRLEFAAGDPMVSVTGENWKSAVDAPHGWEQAGFPDANWSAAANLGPYGMQPWGEVGFEEERALPARMLRTEFDTAKPVRRATAYVSGLGLFEMEVNGRKLGDHVLSPNLSDYDKRVFYVTFDATSLVRPGRNAVGVWLGNGRYWAPRAGVPIGMRSYGYPKAIVQLEIEYADGSRTTVASDARWKLTTQGPILANNEYDGEDYDARKEMAGWSRPGFDDSAWETAREVSPPAGALMAQMAEPIRVVETIRPVSLKQVRPGVWIFDMGQNMVGWCRLHVAGARGTEVRLRHAETLRPDGELYVDNLRSARAANSYILKGGGPEVWEPRFTYHGFRYVELSGFPGTPAAAAIEGRVVHDDMGKAGEFTSSNDLLNRIHRNIYWGVRGNYRSIPTDCPQRDERQGWLGDRSQVSRSESYLFDVAAFYNKWMWDLVDAQRDSGSIPDVVPAYWVLYNDNTTWPGTLVFLPGMLYDQYGDKRAIEQFYDPMKKWMVHMQGFIKDDLMPKDTYGDWCVPPEKPELIHSQDPARRTDPVLIGTAYFYRLLGMMSRYARLLGREADASDYDALARRMRAALERKFYQAGKGYYSNGTQTSGVLALALGIVPEENRARVIENLVRKIETESRGHVGTGLVGAQWLMRALSDNGRIDVAYTIANQKTYPGLGYMVEKGATTIWELWNGDTADPAMNSGNHVMQIGDLGIWMYEYLAGIGSDPYQPGFRHAIVRPRPVGDLKFVKASHRSLYGTVTSAWRRDPNRFMLDVTVPPNTTATVYVPASDAGSVSESGVPVAKARGVKLVRVEDGAAVFEVGSGVYSFTAGR